MIRYMILERRAISLSFFICIIFILGSIVIYDQQVEQRYYKQLLTIIGAMSEIAPESVDNVIEATVVGKEDASLIAEAQKQMAQHGYGKEGLRYVKNLYRYDIILIIELVAVFAILSGLFLMLFRNFKKMNQDVNNLTYRLEQSMAGDETVRYDTDREDIFSNLNEQIKLLVKRSANSILLAKKERQKLSDFIENISHQLKTPIACITLDLDMLYEKEADSQKRESLESCITQILHMKALIMKLLRIGRLEAGKVVFHFEEHDIRYAIEPLVASIQKLYKDKRIILKLEEACNYVTSYDLVWMKEAFENIIKNGMKYTREGCFVTVELSKSSTYIKVVISDNGNGIAQEDLPYLFDRFYRSKTSNDREGIGIGLNLAKMIIEAHHGFIRAESSEEGARFVVILPFVEGNYSLDYKNIDDNKGI